MECPIKLEVNIAKLYVEGCGGIIETRLTNDSGKGLGNISVNVCFRHVTDHGTHSVGRLGPGQSSAILRTQLELPERCRGEWVVRFEVDIGETHGSTRWAGSETILVLWDENPSKLIQIIKGVEIDGERAAMGAYVNVNLQTAAEEDKIHTLAELLLEASRQRPEWREVELVAEEDKGTKPPKRSGNLMIPEEGLLPDEEWMDRLESYPCDLLQAVRQGLVGRVDGLCETFNSGRIPYFGYRVDDGPHALYIYVQKACLLVDMDVDPASTEKALRQAGFRVTPRNNWQGTAGWLTGWRIPHDSEKIGFILQWLVKPFR